MSRLRWKQVERKANQYATSEDFCRVFMKKVDSLYGFTFLLTKDQREAEKCFVAGLEDCLNANQIRKDFALSWARYAIIKQAIRELRPRPDRRSPFSKQEVADPINSVADLELQVSMDGVLSLETFERFVFVMSVLERYSEHECSFLLLCSPRDIRNARLKALQQVATNPVCSKLYAPHRRLTMSIE